MSTEQAKKLTFAPVIPTNPNVNNILKTDNVPYIESNDYCIVLKSDKLFRPTNITIKNQYTYFLSIYCGTAEQLQQLQEISDTKLNNKQKYSKYLTVADSMQCYIEQSQLYSVDVLDVAKCTKVRQYKNFNKYILLNQPNVYSCMLIVLSKNPRFMTQSIGLQWIQAYGYEYNDDKTHNKNPASPQITVKSNEKRKPIDVQKLLETESEQSKRHKYVDFKTSFQNEITTRMIVDVMGENRPEQ